MDLVTISYAVYAVLGAGGLALGLRRRRMRLEALRAAAEACGLERVRTLRSCKVLPQAVTGHAGPLAVTLSNASRAFGGAGGTLVRVHDGLARISVRRAGQAMAVQELLRRAPAFEAGDPAFDQLAHVEGEPVLLQALLDQPTRLGLRQLLAGMVNDGTSQRAFRTQASLRGELRFTFEDDDWLFRERALPLALRGILEFARRLVPPGDIPGRLAANAREDPVDTVRLRNLEMLRRDYPGHGETQRALREACRDANDVVRLFAATSLGAEGREVLLRLATTAEDSCAARAVSALGAGLSAAMALELLAGALSKRRFAAAEACIGVLAGRGGEESVTALSRALLVERGRVAVAAARALGHPDLPAAQSVLLQHGLGHAEAGVRAAAARALGEIGTVDAVLPLHELGARGAPEVRESARAAVAAIQSRLQGATPGQLSMTRGEGGAVSLTPDGGEVSLAPRASEEPGSEPGGASA